MHRTVALTDAAVARAQESRAIGCRTYDALHLACAAHAAVDVFLTTDDRVLRLATCQAEPFQVRVANPVDGLLEVIERWSSTP